MTATVHQAGEMGGRTLRMRWRSLACSSLARRASASSSTTELRVGPRERGCVGGDAAAHRKRKRSSVPVRASLLTTCGVATRTCGPRARVALMPREWPLPLPLPVSWPRRACQGRARARAPAPGGPHLADANGVPLPVPPPKVRQLVELVVRLHGKLPRRAQNQHLRPTPA